MSNLNFCINCNGVNIPFIADLEKKDASLINATKMLECFPGKKMNNFLRNQATKDYINAASRNSGIPVSELLVVVKGGNDKNSQGTWMHKNLALEFARWLSPDFAIWCNRKIKELLTNGVVTLRDENIQLRQINSSLLQTYNSMFPYADYSRKILTSSKMTYSTTDIVKGFSCRISVQDVYDRLEKEGYIERVANPPYWCLKSPNHNLGYLKEVKRAVRDKNGQTSHTVSQARWTENGRWFLRQILISWGVVPRI